ncbi:pyridoxine 4-dehydrogenase [Pseudohyphozyma bogoriensis]|nr:pyridoxine 4-dehydrogenase [Pseudohyphozyma bogoriensis]
MTITATRTIGSVPVGPIGYGLMNFTWKPKQTPDAQAFEAMKLAIDSGATCFNSGEFYGQPERTLGLQLLSRFFEAEPEYAKRVFLSVKGAVRPDRTPDSSDEYLRESVTNINRILKHRKMDLFQPARVDKTRPIEETMKALKELSDEGHFKFIGLSEVSASTIRRAHAVAPVACVEAEYSPWALDIEKNGVLDACKELNIPIAAYSRADIPEGDGRLHFDRFSEENFPKNLELVEKLQAIAARKGVTSAQLVLAWILAQWDRLIPIPGSTRVAGVKESVSAASVILTSDELAEIRRVVDGAKIVGGRYTAQAESSLAV